MTDHIVIVEDDRELRMLLRETLADAGHAVSDFANAESALGYLTGSGPADLVITDLILPGMRGNELLREIRTRRPEVNVMVVTAFGSIDSAIELVKAGAFDYLTKPFGTDEMLLSVDRALSESRLRREVARLSRSVRTPLPGFIGASRVMDELFVLIQRVGPSQRAALICGESGTGKELVARAIHATSGRGAFVAVNCSAFPENLLESELFGHEKGAFTGASRDKPGLFETAHRGTLFLDEVTEMPAPLQPKLLRALESGEIRRVGATNTRMVDVRVIAASNQDLEEAVAKGRFREDLFWRLNVVQIPVPPLRERVADIPLLVEHFLDGRVIAPDALAVLAAYPWPGNVRELRNAIERAMTLSASEAIQVADLPPRIREEGRAAALVAAASRKQVPLRVLERDYILEVLRQVGGNKSRAAEILGLDRKTLYRKLDEYAAEADS
jgi:two-component system response regulator PilR (NtrC family)/two-component system response regulator HydG